MVVAWARRPGGPLALAAAAVACAVLAAFLPVLHNGFVPLDDPENFLANPAYRGLGAGNLAWMWTARHMGHYIPLTWMTLGSDYLLWGLDPAGYHLTSLLLHLANALLFLLLAWRLLRLVWPARAAVAAGAATAALAFAVHPLRVESVAWVSERRDVLCGYFVLLTLLAYAAAKSAGAAGGQSRRRRLLAAACGFYAAALLSKGIAVALPVALAALDAVVFGRLAGGQGRGATGWGRVAWRERAPFVALAAASAVVTMWASRPVLVPVARLGVSDRLAAASYGLVFYLQQTLLPLHVPFLVPWLAGVELERPAFAWRAGVLVAGAAALVALARRSAVARVVLAAFATYVAFVLPVSGLLQAGPQLVAPRYSYLSCLAWALLAGAAVTRFLAGPCGYSWSGTVAPRVEKEGEREARGETEAEMEKGEDMGARGESLEAAGPRGRAGREGWRWAVAAAVVVTAGCCLIAATRREVGRWHDDFTFSAAGIASAPTAWPPRFTLARALLREGRWREAAAQVRQGLRYSPAAVPLEVMGGLLFSSCPDPAVRSAGEALALADRAARATSFRSPAALEALAAAQAENGDFARARATAERALALCRQQSRTDPRVARRLEPALALYARGRPLRLDAAGWS
jgi:hypothetical protein